AAAGLYAAAMSAYLHWLAPRYDAVRGRLKQELEALRAQYQDEARHRRTPGILADLALGWRYFLAFALDAGAINVEEAEAYRERAGAGLTVMGQAQAEHQQAAEPTAHFLRLLCSAISSGRAHVASTAGGEPERPAAWGWRDHATARGETAYLEWKPQGRRVGWV